MHSCDTPQSQNKITIQVKDWNMGASSVFGGHIRLGSYACGPKTQKNWAKIFKSQRNPELFYPIMWTHGTLLEAKKFLTRSKDWNMGASSVFGGHIRLGSYACGPKTQKNWAKIFKSQRNPELFYPIMWTHGTLLEAKKFLTRSKDWNMGGSFPDLSSEVMVFSKNEL